MFNHPNKTLSYFQDDTNDLSETGLHDFLQPLLQSEDIAEVEIDRICAQLSTLEQKKDDHILVLDQTIQMDTNINTVSFGSKNTDIRHGMLNRGPQQTTVDLRKLRNAEKKIEEKRKARGKYDGEMIPEWNPDQAPSMVVNQSKKQSDNKSKDIKIDDFDIQFAGKKILLNANLLLANGRRYGLVGKNGIGKSTLLRAIARRELAVPDHIRILHVEQEIAGDDTSALESVLKADEVRENLLSEEISINARLNKASTKIDEGAELSARLKIVYLRLEEIESDKAESKASAILNGLGFSPLQQSSATKTFSGGWRMRLALARAFFPAVVWLENHFQQLTTTLLVVSHDRSFLDAVCTDILHMHNVSLDAYRGSFSIFVGTRAERRKNMIREYESQLQYRQHLQDFIDRWRYNAKRAEKLPPLIEPPKDDMEGMGEGQENVYFRFPDPEKLSPPILQMDSVTFGYDPSRIILRDVSFDLQMDSKIAIVGPNGAGKSTLIYLLTGQHQPNTGICHRHGRLRLALFSQHHVDQLELGSSSVSFLSKKFPGLLEEDYRKVLARFGLTGMTAVQPIGTLSGGQKSRVVFAWMSMMNPHVLVLDEPTNHLDMDSIDALASALRAFKGGIAIVSHDQQFLDAVCKDVWVCDAGRMTRFNGRDGDEHGVVHQYKRSIMAAIK